MDRRAARMIGLVVFVLLLTALIGSFILLFRRKIKGILPPRVRVEFWIYAEAEGRPSDEDLIKRVVGENPHYRKGNAPVGASEGMTLRDVRFHIGVMLRERNALLFRPEIMAESDAEVPPFLIESLSRTRTIITVKFISESDPVAGAGHLQFVTHATDALAELSHADIVWDVEAQRFYSREELFALLQEDSDATRFDLQVAVRWAETPEEGRAFTRGMAKLGLPDIELSRQPLDQKVLALFLVGEAARMCWSSGSLQPWEIRGFGEDFVVAFDEPKPGSASHRGWVSEMHAGRKRPIPAA